ncbi:MAG TPA: TetR/AcrR family transcriptional regulator [Nocardioidaceae bacterium]|nr:TetR/AcrR family transcriptional regulator [Nocardioidaceae bacterium]
MTLWEATPLPRGRHNLAREDVTSAQRTRIFDGLIHAVAERGYASTPVAEILRRAGVSRETFYQQFSSKQDCFLECLDDSVTSLIALLAADRPNEDVTAKERFNRLLETYLSTLADDPDRARVFLVEVYAAGPDAIVARSGVQELFVDAMLAELGPVDRFACESLVAAIAGRVTMLLASDDPEGIRELGAPYVELAVKMGIV